VDVVIGPPWMAGKPCATASFGVLGALYASIVRAHTG